MKSLVYVTAFTFFVQLGCSSNVPGKGQSGTNSPGSPSSETPSNPGRANPVDGGENPQISVKMRQREHFDHVVFTVLGLPRVNCTPTGVEGICNMHPSLSNSPGASQTLFFGPDALGSMKVDGTRDTSFNAFKRLYWQKVANNACLYANANGRLRALVVGSDLDPSLLWKGVVGTQLSKTERAHLDSVVNGVSSGLTADEKRAIYCNLILNDLRAITVI